MRKTEKRFIFVLLRMRMMLNHWSLVFRKTCFCLSCHVVNKSWLEEKIFKAVIMLRICIREDWMGNMKEFESFWRCFRWLHFSFKQRF